jgi:hypothetical protein
MRPVRFIIRKGKMVAKLQPRQFWVPDTGLRPFGYNYNISYFFL